MALLLSFNKFSLLLAYIAPHELDINCMSETFLIHSLENDSNRLTIDGYDLLRSDNPSNLNKGRVCNYYKEHILFLEKMIFAPEGIF